MKKGIIILLLLGAFSLTHARSGLAGRYGALFSYGGNPLASFNNIKADDDSISAAGGIYHIIDLVAVAPWFGFSSTSFNYTNGAETQETDVNISQMYLGVDVPIYLLNFGKMKFAAVPGLQYISYSRETKTTTVSTGASTTTQNNDENAFGISAHAMLQYPLTEELHLFARAGLNWYNYSDGDKTATTTNGSRWVFGRTTLGLTFYLK